MMKLRTFCDALEKLAPTRYAAKWDNVGLLVEPGECNVEKVLLTNDLTPLVMQEAVDFNANLIIAYHPPLFKEFKKITQDSWKDRLITEALRHNIAIYSPHTAHDAWSRGVNSWLIEGVLTGEGHVPISPTVDTRETYQISGTLIPSSNIKSFKKQFNKVKIDEENNLSGYIFKRDVPLLARNFTDEIENLKFEVLAGLPISGTGMGRKATLAEPATLGVLIDQLKLHLKLDHLRLVLGVNQSIDSKISTIAVCAGSGASILAHAGKVDLWITGEMGHHEALDAQESNTSVLLAEHSNSERGFLSDFVKMLQESDMLRKKNIQFKISELDKDPISVC